MPDRKLVIAGAILCGMAVVLGAFGAHAVKDRLDPTELGWWQTAVQYQMWHGLGVLSAGLAGWKAARLPAWLIVAGTLVFAGSLFAMALGAPRWLGAITPVGGVTMIAGWASLVVQAMRIRN